MINDKRLCKYCNEQQKQGRKDLPTNSTPKLKLNINPFLFQSISNSRSHDSAARALVISETVEMPTPTAPGSGTIWKSVRLAAGRAHIMH